jgi:hypothetical protein
MKFAAANWEGRSASPLAAAIVPQGQLGIARRFNTPDSGRIISSPEGTVESPKNQTEIKPDQTTFNPCSSPDLVDQRSK